MKHVDSLWENYVPEVLDGPPDGFLTPQEARERVVEVKGRCSIKTIYQNVSRGNLECVYVENIAGGWPLIYIDPEELTRWMQMRGYLPQSQG